MKLTLWTLEKNNTTATPGPVQPLPPILDKKEAEDEVLSRENKNEGDGDEGVISDVTGDGAKENGKRTVKRHQTRLPVYFNSLSVLK